MLVSKKELGARIEANLRLLSSMIARKPIKYTREWARTPEEAFSLYTRTSTVNLIHSLNEGLIENGWPFPASMDIESEIKMSIKDLSLGLVLRAFRVISAKSSLSVQLFYAALSDSKNTRPQFDRVMMRYFARHSNEIFKRWKSHPLLVSKSGLIDEISGTYEHDLWAACISTTLPLLDLVTRNYLGTDNLNAGMQVLRDAFFKIAGLRSKDLKPGYAIWDAVKDPEQGNTFALSLEEDLRLPGVYLASFFEFVDTFYTWCSSDTETPPTELNRHAVMHGHVAADYSTEVHATKLLMFFDLTLRVEPFLRIIVHGESAADKIRKLLILAEPA
ncbi:MAG: hypothetical protein ACR65R_19615 [Methylomicrobium sp.]